MPVRLIHVTLAEPVYRARRAHTSSPSFSSHFPVVAPSNQSFSLLFTHLLQLFVPANSSSKLCLLIDKIILYYFNYWLCFLATSSYLAINRFSQTSLVQIIQRQLDNLSAPCTFCTGAYRDIFPCLDFFPHREIRISILVLRLRPSA